VLTENQPILKSEKKRGRGGKTDTI